MRVSTEYLPAYLQKTLYKTAMFFLCFVLLQHGRYSKNAVFPFGNGGISAVKIISFPI